MPFDYLLLQLSRCYTLYWITTLFELDKLQKQMGIAFQNTNVLQQALLHSSYINENPNLAPGDNERLEFLGDALLSFTVAEDLYNRFPDTGEGELTKTRASLIRQETLAQIARELHLGDYLFLGKGEDASGGRQKPSNLADCLEAIIGAVYIDRGFEAAKKFVLDILKHQLDKVQVKDIAVNYKALLQELTQAKYRLLPTYRVDETSGPEHNRRFVVKVSLADKALGCGCGKTKKAAEMEAARQALEILKSE